jgi:AraC-like DNA-binding protein
MSVMPLPPLTPVRADELVRSLERILAVGVRRCHIAPVLPQARWGDFQVTRVPFLVVVERGRANELPAGEALFFPPGGKVDILLAPGSRALRITWDVDRRIVAIDERRRRPRGVSMPGAPDALEELLCQRLAGEQPHHAGALATTLLALVASDLGRSPAPTVRDPDRIETLLRFLRSRCFRPVTRDRAAQACGVHPAHLTRLLRQHCGCGFTTLLRNLRLERAASLLRQPHRTIRQVAEACGFASASHFVQVFKRRHGMTPEVWRHR